MGKNLKDIVDDGFSQLAVLAEKRNEILSRAEMIGNAAFGPQGEDAESKVKAAESHFLNEMHTRVEHLLNELKQTLGEVSNDNHTFQSGIRDSLRLHSSSVFSELSHTSSFLLSGGRQRLESLLYELDSEFQTDGRSLSSEATRMLSDLERISENNQSAIKRSQTEISAKFSVAEHEISAILGKAFDQVIHGTETKRAEVADLLENLYRRQAEKLDAANNALNSRIKPLVTEQCDKMRDSCQESAKNLQEIRDNILASSSEELNTLSKESLGELTQKRDNSRQDLNERLNALRELSARLLKQDHEALHERNAAIAGSADEFCTDLTRFEAAGASRSPVDEAFAELSLELSGIAEELGVKLKELLNGQSDGLGRLSATTDKGFADLCLDFKMQLKELVQSQEQSCALKEEHLLAQLQKLEEQVSETYSLFKASGITGKKDGSNSGGGTRE